MFKMTFILITYFDWLLGMHGSRKFSQGVGGSKIPEGLMENFNMAKINNLSIPGGVRTPLSSPPLDPPMLGPQKGQIFEKKSLKIFSETVWFMKLMLCIHVPGISLYKKVVFLFQSDKNSVAL